MPSSEIDHHEISIRVRPFNKREKMFFEKKLGELLENPTSESNNPTNFFLRPCVRFNAFDKTVSVDKYISDDVADADSNNKDDSSVLSNYKRKTFTFDYFSNLFWSMGTQEGFFATPNSSGTSNPFATQEDVFHQVGMPAVERLFSNLDSFVHCFGQTGAGKTYTMLGYNDDQLGIVPRAFEECYRRLDILNSSSGSIALKTSNSNNNNDDDDDTDDDDASSPSAQHTEGAFFEIMVYEISQERIKDLLRKPELHEDGRRNYQAPGGPDIKIREKPLLGLVLENMTMHRPKTVERAIKLLNRARNERAMQETRMGQTSSRSAMIVELRLHRNNNNNTNNNQKPSEIKFIDPMGSERTPKYGNPQAQHLAEASYINRSMISFMNCVTAAAKASQERAERRKINKQNEGKATVVNGSSDDKNDDDEAKEKKYKSLPFIPVRDSVMTRLMRDVFFGHSKMFVVANVSPMALNVDETLVTLRCCAEMAKIEIVEQKEAQ